MRFPTMAACLIVSGLLLGCRAKEDPKSDSPQTPQPTRSADTNPKTTAPNSGADGVDVTSLPKEGPGDPALTYDAVRADPAKYRGKRVTWAFAPLSSEGKRMMCGLDMNEARTSLFAFAQALDEHLPGVRSRLAD